MGCGSSSSAKCPNCTKFQTKDLKSFADHISTNHSLKSTKCNLSGFSSEEVLASHFDKEHSYNDNDLIKLLRCPKCKFDIENEEDLIKHYNNMHATNNNTNLEDNTIYCRKCDIDIDKDEFIDHWDEQHDNTDNTDNGILCPDCFDGYYFTTGEEFIEHLKTIHYLSTKTEINGNPNENWVTEISDAVVENKKLPKIGDRILSMWSESMWQYFHATIRKFDTINLKYEIDWDDGDTTGRIVDYYNVAVDKVPDENEIGVGSIILFSQGAYTAGATQLTGGVRWHQGRITKIYDSDDKKSKLFDGVHTKGLKDGKFVTYRSYSYEFVGYKLDDLRVGPNVFDIINITDSQETATCQDDIDIYFSFDLSDHKKAKDQCHPKDVSQLLVSNGLKLIDSDSDKIKNNLRKKALLMKQSKVFVACISDSYVLNEQCRMEFQYAKSTLRKPVVPLVFGNGMAWMMSLVGMLIAGELYIHFKDESVKDQKFQEMLKSLSSHVPLKKEEEEVEQQVIREEEPGDAFISYCWSNSHQAKEKKQIQTLSGNKYNDPRHISENIRNSGFTTWIDIERLKSADQNAGLFEQLTEALKHSKVVIPCISYEYCVSNNCKMEFLFANKTLNKTIIPIVVGTGDDWKETEIGEIIQSNEMYPITFQNVSTDDEFEQKISDLKMLIKTFCGGNKEADFNVLNMLF